MWTVLFSQRFDDWLNEQEDALQEKVLADLKKLQVYGPELPRPYADTVKGSRYKNMKELRVQFSGRPIRAFYAFDPIRRAIVLCAGDKSNDKRFYEKQVRIAEDEFAAHLNTLESKVMRTLDEVIASRSPESQARIKEMADEMILEVGLQMMREELQLSQKQVAEAMGISQPAVTKLEQRGNDLKLATLKRYVEAMGGKLSLDVELPTGKRIAFNI
ncbi:putative DNA-binding protein [Escherichia coli]|nr:putative DNA-binding protein [Escherichia coli]